MAGSRQYVSLEGMAELVTTLRSVAPAEARAALRDSLRSGGAGMVSAAKALVPVDSGALKRSMGLVARYYPRKKRLLVVLGPQYGTS